LFSLPGLLLDPNPNLPHVSSGAPTLVISKRYPYRLDLDNNGKIASWAWTPKRTSAHSRSRTTRYVVHCIHRLQHFHCLYTCIERCSPPSLALSLLLVLRISLRGNTWTLSTPHSPEPHIFHLEPGNRFATNTEKLHHPLGDHSIISISHTHTLGSEILARIEMSPFPIFRDQLGCKRLKYGN
jgi:hypothetical protein